MTEQQVDGRSLRFQHRRPEVLDAVMEHVLEHGITELSFRSLGKAVGLSHVTLRHHFGTKDDLVAEIFDVIRARAPIPQELAPAEDGSALIRDLWAGWADERGQRYFRLFFEAYGQALMHPDRYQHFLNGVVTNWLGVVTHLAISAGCPADEAPRFATVLLAQIRGLQLDLLATGDTARVQDALDSILASVETAQAGWQPGAPPRYASGLTPEDRSDPCESFSRPGSWARKERSREATQAHAGADHPQVAGG